MLAIRDALVKEPGVLLWRNNTGRLQDARGRWITYGLGVGGADLVGMVQIWPSPSSVCQIGIFFALEVKRPKEKPTAEQIAWSNAVRGHCGFCATVTSVDEARAALERCRRGERQ